MKIAVLGAAGGIGQALALLLKLNLPENSSQSAVKHNAFSTLFPSDTCIHVVI